MMKIRNATKGILAAITSAVLIFGITGCVPEPEPEPELLFDVSVTVDGQPFDPNSNIEFATLVPNQTQTKGLVITNNGERDALITDLSIAQSGTLFDGGAVTVSIVTPDGLAIAGTVIKVGQTIEAQIVLTTNDNLGAGLNGTIALNFNAIPTPDSTESPDSETPKEEEK